MLKYHIEERYQLIEASIQGLLDKLKREVDKEKFFDVFKHNVREGIVEDLGESEDRDEDDDTESNVQEEIIEKKSRELLDERWSDFEYSFGRTAKEQNGKIMGYRCVSIEAKNLEKFLAALKKGKYLKGYTGIGKWFSWDEETAECHWGKGGKTAVVTVVAEIPYSSLDIAQTAWANMSTEEERELTLKKGATLFVLKVLDNKDKNLLGDDVKSLPAVAEI